MCPEANREFNPVTTHPPPTTVKIRSHVESGPARGTVLVPRIDRTSMARAQRDCGGRHFRGGLAECDGAADRAAIPCLMVTDMAHGLHQHWQLASRALPVGKITSHCRVIRSNPNPRRRRGLTPLSSAMWLMSTMTKGWLIRSIEPAASAFDRRRGPWRRRRPRPAWHRPRRRFSRGPRESRGAGFIPVLPRADGGAAHCPRPRRARPRGGHTRTRRPQ